MKIFPLFLIFLWSCSPTPQKPVEIQTVSLGVEEVEGYPKYLSEWGFFEGELRSLKPVNGVFAYEINSPLFSDYAHKARFISIPEGGLIDYSENEVLEFPKGSVLIKNFYYPKDFRNDQEGRKILETRLLINEDKKWKAIVYQWNEAQTEAKKILLGEEVPVEWKDQHGRLKQVNYAIPSQPQCKSCHDFNGDIRPIGPTVRQLNVGYQLQSWIKRGILRTDLNQFPKLVDYRDENEILDLRARAWLEVNCAHCHRREGPAKNSGLYLLASQADSYKIGVNKPPVAAGKGSGGLKYSIVPGQPDQSILVHRITSLESGEMMPELGRKMVHQEGVELIREWIEEMEQKSE